MGYIIRWRKLYSGDDQIVTYFSGYEGSQRIWSQIKKNAIIFEKFKEANDYRNQIKGFNDECNKYAIKKVFKKPNVVLYNKGNKLIVERCE